MSPILGEKLKYFRERAKISQFDLEIAINASQGSISRIENNKINPTKESVMQIANYLSLNEYEISYLIGKLANPATIEETEQAKRSVNQYFSKTSTLAYLLDDRSRMIDISAGFIKLLDYSEDQKSKILNKTMAQIILDDTLGLKKYISGSNFQKTVYYAFKRTFDEMNFMIGDPAYEEVVKWIKQDPYVYKIWNEFYLQPIDIVRTDESRTVYFTYRNRKIEMKYVNEPLPGHSRFRIVDYQPHKFLYKLLRRFYI